MSYNAEQSLQGKLKMDQTCLDNNTCGFAGVCSIINVKGEAVCTINIWTPIALVFIATFVVLAFVTILLYVDYRKRKPRGLSENEYCSLETNRWYTTIDGKVEEYCYDSLTCATVNEYATINNKDLN